MTDRPLSFFLLADSSAPPSPTSPTAPMPIPDLVSNLPIPVAHAQVAQEPAEGPEGQTPRSVTSVAVRSRTRKPRSSPRKARSPKGARGKRASVGTSPAKGESRRFPVEFARLGLWTTSF